MSKTELLKRFEMESIGSNIFHSKYKFDYNAESIIAQFNKFKLVWFATQLNIFISVGISKNAIISPEEIEHYSQSVYKYALKNKKGLPRGLHSGVVSIAVLIGNTANEDAKQFCSKLSNKHWAAFEIPVVIETDKNDITYFQDKPLWGTFYHSYLRKMIDLKIASLLS